MESQAILIRRLQTSIMRLASSTGPLPELEPWRSLARQARRFGHDGSGSIDQVWTVLYEALDVSEETNSLRRAMWLRFGMITFLMLGLRVAITNMTAHDSITSGVPIWLNVLSVVGCLALGAVVVRYACAAIPMSWALTESQQSLEPSDVFFQWLEMLILGECRTSRTSSSSDLESATCELKHLRSQELRDGLCRAAEKQLVIEQAAAAMTRKNKVVVRHFATTAPALDLLLAGLLGSGLCGIPIVEWFVTSGIS